MVYWANRQGEFSTNATGKVGCPFFGRLIRDCIDRTETAMTQAHAFKAAELCLKAQQMADQYKTRIPLHDNVQGDFVLCVIPRR